MKDLNNDINYYGVSQLFHGHEYKWIFEESVLMNNMYTENDFKTNPMLDKQTFLTECNDHDCGFPIGGSNSSSTFTKRLDTLDDVKAFLTEPAEGPDADDPILVDIAEYLMTVDNDSGSCTDKFLSILGLDIKSLEQFDDKYNHRKNAEMMINSLKAHNYPDFDYNDPFYGNNRDMTYSELCDIYEQNIA